MQESIKFIEVEKYYSNNSVPSVTTIIFLFITMIVWIVIHMIKIKKHRKTKSNRDKNIIYKKQDEEINKLDLNGTGA